jgi:hypothetical protein
LAAGSGKRCAADGRLGGTPGAPEGGTAVTGPSQSEGTPRQIPQRWDNPDLHMAEYWSVEKPLIKLAAVPLEVGAASMGDVRWLSRKKAVLDRAALIAGDGTRADGGHYVTRPDGRRGHALV